MKISGDDRDYVFGLDIGTRNVVGTVGYKEGKELIVLAQYSEEHESRAMLDGQIHDIGRVSATIGHVKSELESQISFSLTEVCIAAAGRVLRTVTTRVEMVFEQEKVVTGEDLNTLDLMGVDQAQKDLLEKDEKYKFYSVGYTVMKYYLNGERFSNLEGHKATRIEEVIIVTFLPEDVVDGLYSAVERCGLTVANLTLEPIAAINVAIPENFRMLNIALVDVGAGTSDICITKDGSIIAYGMIPYAGDELTEVVVQAFLVDFATAEQIKKDAVNQEIIEYSDIMGITHTIKAKEVHALTDPVMEKITADVAEKIKELNGDKSVAATFVVGGGGKVHGFCKSLAEKLDIIEERVALRGEEVMKEVTFKQAGIEKDPLLVTPIGICLNYYEQKNHFIMVRLNGEFIKLYDNGHLKVVDAALQAGFTPDELFPKRGAELDFKVNGVQRMVRGLAGESATVMVNDAEGGLNDRLEPNSKITVEASTVGEQAKYTIAQLDEYGSEYVTFNVNDTHVKCPKFVEVNGKLEPSTYEIKTGDEIETRSFYTVGQLAEFMDVKIDMDYDILVNNRSSDLDTLIYENFSIEWTAEEEIVIGAAPIAEESQTKENASEEASANEALLEEDSHDTEETLHKTNENDETDVQGETSDTHTDDKDEEKVSMLPHTPTEEEDEASRIGKIPPGMGKTMLDDEDTTLKYKGVGYENNTAPVSGGVGVIGAVPKSTPSQTLSIRVRANGEEITLSGKSEYIFVDIFNGIEFDPQSGNGRAVETTRNGEHCVYTTPIFEGDDLRIFWKD